MEPLHDCLGCGLSGFCFPQALFNQSFHTQEKVKVRKHRHVRHLSPGHPCTSCWHRTSSVPRRPVPFAPFATEDPTRRPRRSRGRSAEPFAVGRDPVEGEELPNMAHTLSYPVERLKLGRLKKRGVLGLVRWRGSVETVQGFLMFQGPQQPSNT